MSFTIATTVDEALAALAAGARPIAGGSDLVVGARHGKAPLPDHLVAIDRLDRAERRAASTDGGVSIGALVIAPRHRDAPAARRRVLRALADGSALVGSPSTRNVGTLGGNVMNASPAMDTGAPLVVLGAEVELRSRAAHAESPSPSCGPAPAARRAAPDELCVAVHLPARPAPFGQRLRAPRVPPGDGDRRRRRRRIGRRSADDGTRRRRRRGAHRRRAHDHRRSPGSTRSSAGRRRTRRSPRWPSWPPSRRRRSATCGPAIATAATASV